jgi:hypothetical protein
MTSIIRAPLSILRWAMKEVTQHPRFDHDNQRVLSVSRWRWFDRATDCREVYMHAVGLLQLLLLVAIAGVGAICGFVASVVILRKKRRARAYFVLGVLTGWFAAARRHGRQPDLSLLSALARAAGLPIAVAAARRVRAIQLRQLS